MTTTAAATAEAARSAPRRRGRAAGSALVRYGFIAPAALYLALFFGYPIVKNFTMSFQEYTSATFFSGVAPFVGLANYRAVLADPVFAKALANTGIFTIVSIAGQFVIGMALALFFRKSFPLSGVLRSMLLLPWLLPMIVSAAVWRWILEQDSGILNEFLSAVGVISSPIPWLTSSDTALIAVVMVNIWLGIPFNVVLLYSGLQAIPEQLYEAGEIDGATGWAAFRHITLPLLRPVVSVVLLLGVIYTIKVLDLILGLTGGGPANATQTIATRSYEMSFVEFDFGHGAALGNVLIVIALLFSVIYLRANARAAKKG
ncbi:MAG: carbohydrate ABC transporter permease [Dermabacteraceae bacterium]|uniref:carbohydrate ABC transporter permease n=1 Tax=Brachybacterium sp. TaxID=1891286 RepID=UPI00264DFE28|nr:sugar ABC transporter permease [Brachybacterium sp.]MDN6328386.1 sugar ABC transporter permease [Brachybacterium sp.]MDN6399765.1 sugar ABC transporter permease [Brachybacterium sp.]